MFNLPAEAVGIRLCRVTRSGDLTLCETVIFDDGAAAIDTVLRRAQVSGKVGPIGETGDYWADLMNASDDTLIETVALDAKSYKAIKTKWTRTRLQPSTPAEWKRRYPGLV